MAAIVTTGTRLFTATQIKKAFDNINADTNYLFIGKSTPWTDDAAPDAPVDSPLMNSIVRRDILAMKRISESDVSLGLLRNDWKLNAYYDIYRHDYGHAGVTGVDIATGAPTNPISLIETNHYVITDEYNVYLCIKNGNGSRSTQKPVGTATTIQNYSDGYSWKYMYTISPSDVLKFVTTNFIPVRQLATTPGYTDPYITQWNVQVAAVPGTIENIVIKSGGSGYPMSSTVSVTFEGDGTGANATAYTNSSGEITSIIINSVGQGYSWVNLILGSVGSSQAILQPILAPIGGFGYDASSQLASHYTIISTRLAYDEGAGDFPQVNEYRRIGIIKSPKEYNTNTIANNVTLSATITLTVSGATTDYVMDEQITGSTSGAKGRVVWYDSTNHKIHIVQIDAEKGVFANGEPIVGGSSGATSTLSSITDPEVDVRTGELIYLEHRRPISRQVDQVEDIKIVIES